MTSKAPDETIWVCPHCSIWNSINDKTCDRCGTPDPRRCEIKEANRTTSELVKRAAEEMRAFAKEQAPKKIIVKIIQGVFDSITGIPPGYVVEVRDYTPEDYDADNLTIDEDGEECHISTWWTD